MNGSNARLLILHVLLFLLLCAAGCDRSELDGPPELRLGRDECAECGMMINEDRCSAGAIVERDRRREHARFDDIGCLLDYERSMDEPRRVVRRFVRDYTRRTWLDVGKAKFVLAERDKLVTPMASGIVAFENQSDAAKVAAEASGKLVTWDELREARNEWARHRRAGTTLPR